MFVLFVYVSPVASSVQVTHKPQGSALIWMFPINRTPFTSLRFSAVTASDPHSAIPRGEEGRNAQGSKQ